MQNVGQNFIKHLAGLSTVIGSQGVSQVVGSFDGKLAKFRDKIKRIEKYVLLAGNDDNQSKKLVYQTSRVLLVITFKGVWLSTQKIAWNN